MSPRLTTKINRNTPAKKVEILVMLLTVRREAQNSIGTALDALRVVGSQDLESGAGLGVRAEANVVLKGKALDPQ